MNASTISNVERVIKEYNPEFDCFPFHFPQVTWVDERLATAILEMAEEIKNLQRRINDLEAIQNE